MFIKIIWIVQEEQPKFILLDKGWKDLKKCNVIYLLEFNYRKWFINYGSDLLYYM